MVSRSRRYSSAGRGPYVRAALRAALTPQIETTKATGLVFLLGAMTGLILAGGCGPTSRRAPAFAPAH
jgi:ABC-type iron transport system FetAB permease component